MDLLNFGGLTSLDASKVLACSNLANTLILIYKWLNEWMNEWMNKYIINDRLLILMNKYIINDRLLILMNKYIIFTIY